MFLIGIVTSLLLRLPVFRGARPGIMPKAHTQENGETSSDLCTAPAAAGPYEVNTDCTASFFNPDGSVLADIVVVDGGKELFFTSLTPRRQWPRSR